MRTVKQICGEPDSQDSFSEIGLTSYNYDGFRILIQDDIVKTIIISSKAAPKLWDKISVGDNLDLLLSEFPVAPEEIKYAMDHPPENISTDESELQGTLLLTYNDDFSELQEKQLCLLVENKYLLTFYMNITDDTIEEIELKG